MNSMSPAPPPTLVVLLHGLRGNAAQMAGIAALAHVAIPGAAVLSPEYRARTFSNADAAAVAGEIDREIERYHSHWRARHVVLVGYSIGAELVRRAHLDARDRGAAWVSAVDRLVLIAGVRGGWSVTPPPRHMAPRTRLAIVMGRRFARIAGIGKLARAFERGAPFITDLEERWSALELRGAAPSVVELFGDRDDMLTPLSELEIASRRRAVIRVRRSTHRDILAVDARPDGSDPATWRSADDPRRERRDVLRAALIGSPTELRGLARRRAPREIIPLDATARG